MKLLSVMALMGLFTFSSCLYDKLEEMENIAPCDTSDVTYTKDIKPLIATNCGPDNSCHQLDGSDSEIPLVSYEPVKGVAETGQLLGAVTHDVNYEPMPKDADKLSECNINLIKAWINQGLKEN